MEDLFILNKIRHSGPSGHRYHEFIGVYDNNEDTQKQIQQCLEENPPTSDYMYYFEIIRCPLNKIGYTKYESSYTNFD